MNPEFLSKQARIAAQDSEDAQEADADAEAESAAAVKKGYFGRVSPLA